MLSTGVLLAARYRLGRRIAVGGMGEVWEAADALLDRAVAVKVLRPELSGDPEFLSRFRAEARTTASLNHPGIAAVHDYGETSVDGRPGTAYLVMELVRGEPLSAIISRLGRVGSERTLDVLEQAGHALQAAHERGLVHRDVKPANILLTPTGQVKLTDFGIAKAVDAAPLTRSGMVMGTAHYIAPEQATGQEAGPAADVYSLGVVGYECLAGRRPFRSDNAVTVAMQHIHDPPPPLPPDVPPGARALIAATLIKDPGRRYATGGEFAAAVAAVRAGRPLPAPGRLGDTVVAAQPPTRLLTGGYPPPPGGSSTWSEPLPAEGGRFPRWPLVALLVAVALGLLAYGVLRLTANSPEAGSGQPTTSPARQVPPVTTLPTPRPTTAPPTTAPSTRTAPTTTGAATFDENPADFIGRPADRAADRLAADGLSPRVRSTAGGTPADPGGCLVLAISPTDNLRPGQTVTVTCQEFGR